ncbi:MAG: S8 family serine peptidase [Acholeplasmataceae bacterium]|nr:S8 family serine peptidase [Acholeplasmataceae bacterium]
MLTLLMLSAFFMYAMGPFGSSAEKDYELLYQVEDVSEANLLASTYGLELMSLSSSMIAFYKAPNEATHEALIDIGFADNATRVTQGGPPFSTKDPYYDDQYHIPMMSFEDAWLVTEGNADLVVAVIDSGIDTDNPEFEGRISPLSYNARTKDVGIAHVEDTDGHGTMVAGIIAANKDNRIGIAGIVQYAQLMVIKASNEEGTYDDVDLIEAINYAALHGAKVINMSLGGTYANPLIQAAIDDAIALGAVVVAASGNDGDNTIIYPAAFDNTISVGAVDETSAIADYSNHNQAVDVVAPGSAIVTTYIEGDYMLGSGTSFAAPMISGVLGLMFAADETLSVSDAMARIRVTASDLGTPGKDDYYGYGLVDAFDALSLETVTVSFDTDGGLLLDPILVPLGYPFEVPVATKGYHTFEGWYVDEAYLMPFVEGVSVVQNDTLLYAKFEPIPMTVSFVTSGDPLSPISVPYGTSFVPPAATKEGHVFGGWYLGPTFKVSYDGEPVTADLVLYAKFDPLVHTVSFVTEGTAIESLSVAYGTTLELPLSTQSGFRFLGWTLDADDPMPLMHLMVTGDVTLYAIFEASDWFVVTFDVEGDVLDTQDVFDGDLVVTFEPVREGERFLGWYTDVLMTVLYLGEPVRSDLILYGGFEPLVFDVLVYGLDRLIPIGTYQVSYGGTLELDVEVEREPSEAIVYTFVGWSASLEQIRSDLEVYPVFDYALKPGAITLGAGVDTVSAGALWTDGSLIHNDPNVTIEASSDLDHETPGVYQVTYDIMVDQQVIGTMIRKVMVLEPAPRIVITLNPDVTTILRGTSYVDAGATTNANTLITEGEVDVTTVGTYVITYRATEGKVVVSRVKMVHVIMDPNDNLTLDVPRKEEGWWNV